MMMQGDKKKGIAIILSKMKGEPEEMKNIQAFFRNAVQKYQATVNDGKKRNEPPQST